MAVVDEVILLKKEVALQAKYEEELYIFNGMIKGKGRREQAHISLVLVDW